MIIYVALRFIIDYDIHKEFDGISYLLNSILEKLSGGVFRGE